MVFGINGAQPVHRRQKSKGSYTQFNCPKCLSWHINAGLLLHIVIPYCDYSLSLYSLYKLALLFSNGKYQAYKEAGNTQVDVLPGNQRSFFLHSLHGGVKVQGALVQAQKLSDAFSSVQVAVLVDHLHKDDSSGEE